ncbi:phosphoribosyltransferase-like protein [Hymenobacter jejuensis]|uniref:PRTase-CE domain-containing protein n=1 Tax=Hymenobacter jejuensis TaxID=2502781 RepID=A0A5B8A1G2_9BACT|nr:hypothetical protein [Hymenobacter jejuensis]QDA59992.1 hypothetical protein FHG12_07645 [Hymenobacter jejuensis]
MPIKGLDISSVRRLKEKFKSKGWDEVDTHDFIFDNFCCLLSFLNEREKELLIELTEEYLWVRNNDYYSLLIYGFELIAKSNLSINKVYILAMISPDDRRKNKIKSANKVAYDCMDFTIGAKIPFFHNVDFQLIHNIDSTLPNPRKMNNSIILMVDDYIGSGETALEALAELEAAKPFNKDKIFILGLVAQQKGIDKIKDAGYNNVFCSVIKNRGITDRFPIPPREDYLKMMGDIETRMGVEDDFRLGKGASEALVTMIKTPNNTFPVFWFEPKKVNSNWKVPFRRKS